VIGDVVGLRERLRWFDLEARPAESQPARARVSD
jgi:hypothetical protein